MQAERQSEKTEKVESKIDKTCSPNWDTDLYDRIKDLAKTPRDDKNLPPLDIVDKTSTQTPKPETPDTSKKPKTDDREPLTVPPPDKPCPFPPIFDPFPEPAPDPDPFPPPCDPGKICPMSKG